MKTENPNTNIAPDQESGSESSDQKTPAPPEEEQKSELAAPSADGAPVLDPPTTLESTPLAATPSGQTPPPERKKREKKKVEKQEEKQEVRSRFEIPKANYSELVDAYEKAFPDCEGAGAIMLKKRIVTILGKGIQKLKEERNIHAL